MASPIRTARCERRGGPWVLVMDLDLPWFLPLLQQRDALRCCSCSRVERKEESPCALNPDLPVVTYHHQSQEEYDGAAEVGVLVLLGLVLQVIDQLQCQLLLKKKPKYQKLGEKGGSGAGLRWWRVQGLLC